MNILNSILYLLETFIVIPEFLLILQLLGIAVKIFINFYEFNLIEECSCGNDYYFYPAQKGTKTGL